MLFVPIFHVRSFFSTSIFYLNLIRSYARLWLWLILIEKFLKNRYFPLKITIFLVNILKSERSGEFLIYFGSFWISLFLILRLILVMCSFVSDLCYRVSHVSLFASAHHTWSLWMFWLLYLVLDARLDFSHYLSHFIWPKGIREIQMQQNIWYFKFWIGGQEFCHVSFKYKNWRRYFEINTFTGPFLLRTVKQDKKLVGGMDSKALGVPASRRIFIELLWTVLWVTTRIKNL